VCNETVSARFTGRLSSEVETDSSFQRAQLHRQAADALPFAHEGENEEQGECVRFISLHFITERRPRFSLYSPPVFIGISIYTPQKRVLGAQARARFFCCCGNRHPHCHQSGHH